jgi:hypothetical protein
VVCAHLYHPNPHLKPLLADFRKQDSWKTETDGQGLIALRTLRPTAALIGMVTTEQVVVPARSFGVTGAWYKPSALIA